MYVGFFPPVDTLINTHLNHVNISSFMLVMKDQVTLFKQKICSLLCERAAEIPRANTQQGLIKLLCTSHGFCHQGVRP